MYRHIDPLTDCVVDALSWGWRDEMQNNGHITTTRNTTSTKTTNNLGFNIVELNVTKCSTSNMRIFFDTSRSNSASSDMADYINGLPMSTVLIGVTAGGVGSGLETQGTTALLAIGVNVTGLEVWGGKLAFVAQVSRPALTVMRMGPQGGDNLEIKVNVKGI